MLSILGMLLVASTAYDMIARRSEDREPHKLLIAFSVYTNGQKLFKVNRNTPSKSIDCLEGLRCISLISIILAHRVLLQIHGPTSNLMEVLQRYKYYWYVSCIWQVYCVDTFLVIGGFLSALQLLTAFERKTFNALKMIIHRYIRYTPVLAASILIFTSLSRHVKGPYPDAEGSENCRKYWWSALTHFQNYINPGNVCPTHAWYLSVDFQLFIISPLLIYPARQYGWKYLWNLPALAILSSISVMMTCLVHKFEPGPSDTDKSFELINIPTHARVAPWLTGMVLGYIIYESRAREITMSKAGICLCWILSFSILIFGVAVLHPFSQFENNQMSVMQNAIYRAFCHLLWSLPIAWIIFACYKLKSGGIIRWLLSLREWQPLGRLTLSMYITHLFYQRLTVMNEKTGFTHEMVPLVRWSIISEELYELLLFFFQFAQFFGDLLVTVVLGTLFWLTFEYPLVLIENYCRDRQQTMAYTVSEPLSKNTLRSNFST